MANMSKGNDGILTGKVSGEICAVKFGPRNEVLIQLRSTLAGISPTALSLGISQPP